MGSSWVDDAGKPRGEWINGKQVFRDLGWAELSIVELRVVLAYLMWEVRIAKLSGFDGKCEF